MATVNVLKGASLIIKNGPSKLGIEHSMFDEQDRHSGRKHVRFEVIYFESVRGGTAFQRTSILEAMVVGAIRKDPTDGIGIVWILNLISGGAHYIAEYSTQERTGSAIKIKKFPDHPEIDHILKLI